MRRFTRILFVNEPAGRSDTALERAVRLARSNEAELTLVNVMPEIPQSMPGLQKTLVRTQEDELQSLAAGIPGDGPKIHSKVLLGTPFLELIKEVSSGGHDLVIKAAEGRGGLASALFGSTDLHLLRKCPCPVWVIKPTRRRHYARILAAVDTDPSEAANAELNALILDLSTSLARSEHSELHVAHAWAMPYESILRSGRAHLPKSDIDRMVRDTRKAHKRQVDELLAGYELHDLNATVHLVKGEPGKVIPALARRKRVELIVMGTVARTGIPGFFIGNTAEKTLAEVDCSVLAVKPGSFKTPVRT